MEVPDLRNNRRLVYLAALIRFLFSYICLHARISM